MNVLVEFTVGGDKFAFADALSTTETSVALERFVPVTEGALPLVWVTGGDAAEFERAVSDDEHVGEVMHLVAVSNSHLYRVTWAKRCPLLDAIAECGGVILEANADERWFFRTGFPTHDAVSSFYDCLDDVDLEVDRVSTLDDEFERDLRFGLTPEQRDAVALALDRGYFRTPREATLSDLANELGITQQALSDRVRRANQKVLAGALRSGEANGYRALPRRGNRDSGPDPDSA